MTFTPQMIAWAGSLAGALLFFGAGFYFARSRSLPAEPQEPAEPENRADSDLLQTKLEDLKGELKSMDQQRSHALWENQELRQSVEKLKKENAAFINAAKKRFLKMKKELQASTAESVSLRSQMQKLLEQSSLSDSVKEDMLLEKSNLSDDLKKAEKDKKELTARLSELESSNHELMIRSQKLNEQLKEFERLQDESRKLKSQVAELSTLQDELDALKKDNARLLSQGIVLQDPPQTITALPSSEGIGGTCQNVVNQLSQEKSSRGVVMADELGLLIAGTGDHMEPMAALAAIFSNVSSRIESMMPIGDISKMTINNAENLTITLQPLQIDSDRMIVSALSVGPGPGREQITELIRQAAA